MPEPEINERFARFLRDRLRIVNDGELPSVSIVTARFNHIDNWQRPVSAEGVRRWMRGMSLPELSRLPALCRMLKCTPADIVGRLDYLRRLLYDLGRSYNESGMRRWFWRHRPALDGKCPGALLSGDWDPNGAAAQQVRLLAVS